MNTMTDEKCADYVRRAMSSRRGDDLERANCAFRRMSDKELDKPYGMSGKTAREVWQEYKDDRDTHEQVQAWLGKVLPHYAK